MRKLVAMWVGELGWELLGFQGFVRAMSRDYDHTTVISRPGREVLYDDFCDEFIEYIPDTNETRYSKCKDVLPEGYYDQFEYDTLIPAQTNLINWSPTKGFWGKNKIVKDYEQEFIKYGEDVAMFGYDILVHARATNKLGSGTRNWGIDNWQELVDRLSKDYRIASIGATGASLHLLGTNDMRDIELRDLCGLMHESSLVIGGSSRPMHLAALCDTSLISWGAALNKPRYERDWNPHNTKVMFHGDDGWKPKVKTVEKLVKDYFVSLSNY